MDPYTKPTGSNLVVDTNTQKLKFMLFLKDYEKTDKDICDVIKSSLKVFSNNYDEDPSEENCIALKTYMTSVVNTINDEIPKSSKDSSGNSTNIMKNKIYKALKEQIGIDLSNDVTELDLFNRIVTLIKANSDASEQVNEIETKQKKNKDQIDILKKMNDTI